MKKTIGLIVIMMLMLVCLTGCVKINYEVTINKNGSGEISYVYGLEKSVIQQLQISDEDMEQKAMEQKAIDNGYTTEPYEDDEIKGFKATKHVANISKDMSMEENFGEEYIKDNGENRINIDKGIFKTIYSQNATIDLTSMSDMGNIIAIKYIINLPEKVTQSNATEVLNGGKTLSWDLKAGTTNLVQFNSEKSGLSVLTIIIIAVIVVIIALAVIVVICKKKNEKNKETTIKVEKAKKDKSE